jgi:hypothetical protein
MANQSFKIIEETEEELLVEYENGITYIFTLSFNPLPGDYLHNGRYFQKARPMTLSEWQMMVTVYDLREE